MEHRDEMVRAIATGAGALKGGLVGAVIAGPPGILVGMLVGTGAGVIAGQAIRPTPNPSSTPRARARRGHHEVLPRGGRPSEGRRENPLGPGFGGFYRESQLVPSGFGPIYNYPQYPYYQWPYTYYYQNAAEPTGMGPQWWQSKNCPGPLSLDCQRLTIGPRWATFCFMPTYQQERLRFGTDVVGLATAVARRGAPWCPIPPQTEAGEEYVRRVAFAVAILSNASGGPQAPYPDPPPGPRPALADTIAQPWVRALMTGWI